MDSNCLQMIRDAYWNDSSVNEFNSLHDILTDTFGITPSVQQLRAAFNLLPTSIIGDGIRWGFSDTGVRELIFDFIKADPGLFRKAMEI